ncbi:DUF6334 family protein [Planctomycetota bacterium]
MNDNANGIKVLNTIIESREELNDVMSFVASDGTYDVEGICFSFSANKIYFTVDRNEDTVLLMSEYPINLRNSHCIEVSGYWDHAYGKPLLWYWLMKNNRGYLDGIQFEFAKDTSDESVCIQLICLASRFSISQVTKDPKIDKHVIQNYMES